MPVVQLPSLLPDSQNSCHRVRILQMFLIERKDIQLAVFSNYVGSQIPHAVIDIQQQILHARPGAFEDMVFILQGLSPDTGTAVQQITVNHFHGTLAEGTDREPASWSSRSPMISPMCSTVRSSLLPERFTLSRAIMAINNSSRGHISRRADTARAADRPGGNSRWDESFPEPIPRSNPYLTGTSPFSPLY